MKNCSIFIMNLGYSRVLGDDLMIINLANPKTKKTYTVKTEDLVYVNKKLGNVVSLSVLNVNGKGKITGGSTKTGATMAPFVEGAIPKRVLLSDGLGFKTKRKGEKRRKTVFGNTINDKIEQINIKITELDSSVKLDDLFPKKQKESKK